MKQITQIFFGRWECDFNLDSKFQLQQTILFFETNPQNKVYVRSITEKMNVTIEFFIFELVLSTNFQLKLTILIFLDQNLPKKVFPVKN